MKLSDPIIAGIAGTTTFSAFSYLIAALTDNAYEQPKLLGKMVDRSPAGLNKKEAALTGWLIHYLVGIGCAVTYKIIIDAAGIKPGLKNGVLAGAITGIPAVITWKTSLELHPLPPRKKSWDYYLELIAGHIIFGATCFWIFKKRDRRRAAVHSYC